MSVPALDDRHSKPSPAPVAAQSPVAPPPTADEAPEQRVRGYEAEAARRSTVYQLAAALILASLFSMAPAVLDAVEHFRTAESLGVSRWAFLLLLAGTIQITYAVYMVQLPDWSTVWVVSLVTLGLAMIYAMLLGVFMLADQESEFVQILGLGDKLPGHRAAGWCLIMLSLSCLLAYATGRVSVRWHHAYRILYSAGVLSRK